MNHAAADVQCNLCGIKILDVIYAIYREAELMHFSKSLGLHRADIEVNDSKSIANFCSKKCRRNGKKAAMIAESVPLPATPPLIGPIEVCAKCGGIVDMTQWHLVYIQCDDDAPRKKSKRYGVKDLAVVCRKCAHVQLPTALLDAAR